jgi:hypothetical protein
MVVRERPQPATVKSVLLYNSFSFNLRAYVCYYVCVGGCGLGGSSTVLYARGHIMFVNMCNKYGSSHGKCARCIWQQTEV